MPLTSLEERYAREISEANKKTGETKKDYDVTKKLYDDYSSNYDTFKEGFSKWIGEHDAYKTNNWESYEDVQTAKTQAKNDYQTAVTDATSILSSRIPTDLSTRANEWLGDTFNFRSSLKTKSKKVVEGIINGDIPEDASYISKLGYEFKRPKLFGGEKWVDGGQESWGQFQAAITAAKESKTRMEKADEAVKDTKSYFDEDESLKSLYDNRAEAIRMGIETGDQVGYNFEEAIKALSDDVGKKWGDTKSAYEDAYSDLASAEGARMGREDLKQLQREKYRTASVYGRDPFTGRPINTGMGGF